MIEIHPGGKLFMVDPFDIDDDVIDVTDEAITLLFEPCTLHKDLKLKDIFLLLGRDPDFYDIVLGNNCSEYINEALKDSQEKEEEIEYLEFRWDFVSDKDGQRRELAGNNIPSFQGVGYLANGQRETYAVDLTPLNKISNLKVKINDKIDILDLASPKYKIMTKFDNSTVMLGQLLFSLIFEIGFHGSPEERDKFKNELIMRIESDVEIVHKPKKQEGKKPVSVNNSSNREEYNN